MTRKPHSLFLSSRAELLLLVDSLSRKHSVVYKSMVSRAINADDKIQLQTYLSCGRGLRDLVDAGWLSEVKEKHLVIVSFTDKGLKALELLSRLYELEFNEGDE